MATLFDEILTKGVRTGQVPARTQAARTWYRDTAKEYRRVNDSKLMKGDADRLTARPLVGQMYMYYHSNVYVPVLFDLTQNDNVTASALDVPFFNATIFCPSMF